MKDLCQCGNKKDRKSNQCMECRREKSKNRPCRGCHRILPITSYHQRQDNRRPTYCKECESKDRKSNAEYYAEYRKSHAEKARNWRRRNKESYRKYWTRRGWRMKGLDPDIIDQYVATHDCCEICGKKGNGRSLCVDHCHNTNQFRGLLCHSCNTALGLFRDKPELLMRAAEYLSTFRANSRVQTFRGS